MPRALIALPLTALMTLAAPAGADPQLDRMEDLSERMNALINAAAIAELPALEGSLPAPDWDEPMRGAFACVLDAYRAEIGRDGVDAMLDQMDAALVDLTPEALMSGEMDAQMQLPEGLSEARSVEIMNSCRVIELMMERMMNSDAMDVMRTQ